MEDAGLYKCVAKNREGYEAQKIVNLIISGIERSSRNAWYTFLIQWY